MTPRTALTTIAAAGAALALTACLDGSGGSSIDGIPDPLSSNQCDRPVPACEPGYTRNEGVDRLGRRRVVCDGDHGLSYGVWYRADTGEAFSYSTSTFAMECDREGDILAMYRAEDSAVVCVYDCDTCPADHPALEVPPCDAPSPITQALYSVDGFAAPDADLSDAL